MTWKFPTIVSAIDEGDRGGEWKLKSQVRRLNCEKCVRKLAFNSCRIRGHCCYFLTSIEPCDTNLVGNEHNSEDWGDRAPLSPWLQWPPFFSADRSHSRLVAKGFVGTGRSGERGETR